MAHEVIAARAEVPDSGVRLNGGALARAFENNIRYLKSLSMDAILYWFRRKAGLPSPGEPYRGHFEDEIKGQTSGLYLMGAANALRWTRDAELSRGVTQIVDTIERAAEPDGFFEPIDKSEFGTLEYPNYVRVWMNYGLKAASRIGNEKALPLMRNMQSWFNRCDERFIARHLALGFQGVIANTTVALSEVGLPEDLETVVDHYQENWWLGELIRGEDGAIHKRPTPHGTELEAITAYMDMYRATGKPLYLNAVNGAYRMYRDKWQHVGGGIVAIELTDLAPGCYWLDPVHKYNELCCSAHWLYLNQRFHQLFPDEERYVAEIEKTLYNVVIANQAGGEHIRYHAYIDLQKDGDRTTPVSCCAGLGTRILGSLPEFLFSRRHGAVSVDIYADSTYTWGENGRECAIEVRSPDAAGGAVEIEVSAPPDGDFALSLRVPSWVSAPVPFDVNGSRSAVGAPGTYCSIERRWKRGDVVSFSLPAALRCTRYRGSDGVGGHERYAYELGPLLLAFRGNLDSHGKYLKIIENPEAPREWLVESHAQRFSVRSKPGCDVLPYYEVGDEVFTCYPIFPAT